jgi:immune inhibitor A
MQFMFRKLFYLTMILALVLGMPASFGIAQASQQAQTTPKPIGMISPTSKHLARPPEEVVVRALTDEGVLALDATQEQVQSAVDRYFQEFSKQSSDWITPEIQMAVQKHETELASGSLNPQAAPAPAAVSVSIFALAVDFGGTDTFTTCGVEGTYSGPMQGEVPPPAEGDNQSIWYSPEQTADPNFYSDLIFGYKGVGRVRMDLLDPNDGQPGINLAGYTVQDYYDHFAGKGNVTLEGLVSGWVTVNHSEALYGAPLCNSSGDLIDNDSGGTHVGQVVVDAIDAFQAEHPTYYTDTSSTAFWKQFDKNEDGMVDTTWIIHAGAGEESGGGAQGDNAIWSHSWTLAAQGIGPLKVYEGDPLTEDDDIYIDPYTVQPEMADLGVFVEEFGHNFFGLPDLYTTDAENSVGFWSEMASGSWGGDLGGSTPVGMPLWFRMIAVCGEDALGNATFCNWQYPMVVRDYQDAASDILIGAIDGFDDTAGANKGIQINLPSLTTHIDNQSGGSGNAVWSGTGVNDLTSYLSRDITVPASGNMDLTFQTFWFIEDCRPSALCDYGAVQVKDGANPWVYLDDGVNFDTSFGAPILLGKGGPKVITIDLSVYAGKTVTLRFKYSTDPGYTDPGWWIDDVTVGGILVDDFTGGLGGWTAAPADAWKLVPYSLETPRYYLVEWRSTTKYDKFLRAYVTTDSTDTVWRVERVPYNIPGAVVYLRDAQYPEGYSQRQYYSNPPSYGPKNKLLVVDLNYKPMRLFEQGLDPVDGYWAYLNPRSASYDAALTLQPSQPITLSKVYGLPDVGPFSIPAKPAVTTFNDAMGYYAGFYYGAPCTPGYICYANRDGSVVVPARDVYSTRITDFSGNPLYDFYGVGYGPSWMGSGNPGDDMVQFGVNLDLLSKSVDGMQGMVRVRNYSVDFSSTSEEIIPPVDPLEVVYTTEVENMGTEMARDMHITFNLDPNLTFLRFESAMVPPDPGPITPQGMVKVFNIPSLDPGDSMEVKLVARYTPIVPPMGKSAKSVVPTVTTTIEINDGQMVKGPFWVTTEMVPKFFVLMPMVKK